MPWVEKAFEEPEHVLSLTVGGNVGHSAELFLLVKPLYDKNEHLTTTGFLKAKFGTLDCPTGHQDIWRSELTRQTRNSHSFFSRNFCYVANKDGDTVLMEPFVGQAILRYSLDSQIRNELPGRIAEVKARQLGWTIENISRTLHFCLDENCRGLILVDDEDIAAEQALRLNTMLNGLPQWLSPMRRIQNLKHLVFDNPNPKERAKNPGLIFAAQITVPSAFRGAGGKLCVIIAEYAWMQAERQNAIQMGLISAIPQRANTILVYDTTPNGFDDSYYPMVMKAVENNPKWIKRIENWKGELKAQDVLDGILGVPDVVEKGYPGKIVPALCPWRFHEEYCQIAGTLVSCLDGLRPIESLQVGDITTHGPISETFAFRERPTITLTTNLGREITCTKNHPLLTERGWVIADECLGLKVEPSTVTLGETRQIHQGVPIDEATARLLGYFMANGSLADNGGINFTWNNKDQDVINDIVQVLSRFRSHFPFKPSHKPVVARPHTTAKSVYVRCQVQQLTQWFSSAGMFKEGKRAVCVPQLIYNSPRPIVREFLRGLFEGDGNTCKRYLCVSFSTKHRRFAQAVLLLLQAFGIQAYISKNNRILQGVLFEGWRVVLTANESEKFYDTIGFVSQRKSKPPIPANKNRSSLKEERIVSIRDSGEQDVFDFSVPGKDSYVSEGIIVHNSSRCRTTPRGELRPMTPTQRKEMESNLGKISQYGGEEEIELRDKYGVCLERLWWRRIRIDGYEFPTEEGRLLAFRQEFLSTVAGAFLDSGSAPFDRSSMDALSRQERNPIAVGLFRGENEFDHHNENSWQQIRLYAPPEPGEQYTMGIDTDVAYESPDSDATVATVVRFRDKKVVCVYEARVPSHELIKQLYCIYKWYNNCYYAIEQVGMGYDLIRRCIDRGMGNVHYYKRYDVDYPQPSNYPGWETNRITRSLMDQTLTEVICHRNPSSGKVEPLVNIPDAKTINEIRGLSRTNTGAFKSARGHDDHVDALDIALCIALDPFSGLVKRVEKEKEERKQEFNAYFNRGQASRDRNHPSLATL